MNAMRIALSLLAVLPLLGSGPQTPVRRLTHNQYNNTVRDLLGDFTRPADQFPPDLYVVPSLRLIVVRHGNGGSFSDAAFLRLLLNRQRG